MSDLSQAILLTPPGAAAIAVVRISGPRVSAFLAAHVSRPAKPGRAVHAELRDGARTLDDPVIVQHVDAPTVDINLHGGPWVVASVLALLRREGFAVTEPSDGELPNEAVEEEGLLWREVMSYLPLARTEQALRVLLAQPAAWAGGDPPDPEDASLWWLLHPPRVALVGLPNVGKSTVANQLFAQERSITADQPGTTRDWVGEIANLDGLAVLLVDTPGVRDAPDEIERIAIQRGKAEATGADLVVLILDASSPVTAEQQRLFLAHGDAVIVQNKSDVPAATAQNAMVDGIQTVATTGEGIDALRKAIRRRFGCETFDEVRPRWWTERQRRQLGPPPPQ